LQTAIPDAALGEARFPFYSAFSTARNGRLEKPDFTGFSQVKPDHRHRLLRTRREHARGGRRR
jgi:hypothetical protein